MIHETFVHIFTFHAMALAEIYTLSKLLAYLKKNDDVSNVCCYFIAKFCSTQKIHEIFVLESPKIPKQNQVTIWKIKFL